MIDVVLLLLCHMLWIVGREGWLLDVTMKFVMLLGDLACLAYKGVIREPVVPDGDADGPGLIADLCVHRVWQPQGEALFDMRVVDTDVLSYISRSVVDVFFNAEDEKRESIDWLLRFAMLLFCLLSSLWMVPWVKGCFIFCRVALIWVFTDIQITNISATKFLIPI